MAIKQRVIACILVAATAACGAKAAPETGEGPAPAANHDRDLITREELMAPGGMGAQSLYTAIKTLRPTFLTVRGAQSFSNSTANPDEGAVHVSVDNGRILPLDELQTIHTATVKEVRYYTSAQAMQKFGGAARSGPVILVTTVR
jgi:hypothetical protein